jgi:hypothetical protein
MQGPHALDAFRFEIAAVIPALFPRVSVVARMPPEVDKATYHRT